ncbi:MAG: ATP-binding protein [Polyangiaceae bacterium]|nr:ATP-binding protein [Polyangiaceae bacterium]
MTRFLTDGSGGFSCIREDGYFYVDKTKLIHQLVTGSGRAFFLSRPRRFGKTLLCSTLEALFSGNRRLFGEIGGYPALAIDSLDWDWRQYPVIKLSLNAENYQEGIEALHRVIATELEFQAEKLGVELPRKGLIDQFKYLIKGARDTYRQNVVVVIDEYDKPLLETIDQPDVHEQCKQFLRGFYGVVKHLYDFIRFIFVTGVTKFSKVSLFSELNNLTNLSLDSRYAAICGITQVELEENLESEITAIAASQGKDRKEYIGELREFYNGYRFSKANTQVYNPFGLLMHFESGGEFQSYWYETGSPSFLVRLVSRKIFDIPVLAGMRVSEKQLRKYNVDTMATEAVLYQAGYLTITDYDAARREYVLKFPNEEIRSEYMDTLLSEHALVTTDNKDALIDKLPTALRRGDIDGAVDAMYAFLESIPGGLPGVKESIFETAIVVIFKALGVDCRSEVSTNRGRIDTVVETANYVYVFEFKVGRSSNAAMKQINDKGYANQWLGGSRRVFKVGVAFDREVRNIVEWQCEVVEAGEWG